jgi:acetyl esterase/lipase
LWSSSRPEQYPEQPDAEPDVIPQRVVALAPVTDLAEAHRLDLGEGAAEEFLRRSPEEGPERYAVASPLALLPLGARQLIVHGDADVLVPIGLSQAYAAAAAAAGDDVTLHSHEGSDHFVVIDPSSSAWDGVVEWLLA